MSMQNKDRNPMSIRKFLLSWILCAGIFIGINLLWHLLLFSNFYTTTQNQLTNAHLNYIVLVSSDIYRSLIFSFTYTLFVRKHSSVFRGVLFGLCVGLLLASVSGIYFATFKLNNIQWLWYEGANLLIQSVIAGILIPVICWRTAKPNPES